MQLDECVKLIRDFLSPVNKLDQGIILYSSLEFVL